MMCRKENKRDEGLMCRASQSEYFAGPTSYHTTIRACVDVPACICASHSINSAREMFHIVVNPVAGHGKAVECKIEQLFGHRNHRAYPRQSYKSTSSHFLNDFRSHIKYGRQRLPDMRARLPRAYSPNSHQRRRWSSW